MTDTDLYIKPCKFSWKKLNSVENGVNRLFKQYEWLINVKKC